MYLHLFLLSGLFHYSDRFLHHLVWKNEGRVSLQKMTWGQNAINWISAKDSVSSGVLFIICFGAPIFC